MLSKKKIILVGLAVLLLLFLGVVFFLKIKNSNVVAPVDITSKEEARNAKRVEELKSLDQAMDKIRLIDKDLDGLTDEEEKGLGTDPLNADTDGDGLLDNAEIKNYKTNPLKKDTDGDGKDDGSEIWYGSDPLKK